MKQQIILNSKGDPIVLNEHEMRVANIAQKYANALGFDVNITTLTTVLKKVTEQKLYQIPFADYIPVVVGEGAFSQQLTTYRSFNIADKFATGIINTGSNDDRLASADTGIEAVNAAVRNWAKTINWSIFDLEFANKSGNWDLITAKETSRKANWDLGLQEVAFLGLTGDTSVLGLYTQAGITTDAATIPTFISVMTPTQLNAMLAALLGTYRTNNNFTAYPTHFIIPETDYNGLASLPDVTFPLRSKLEVLETALKTITMKPGFKILPAAYGNKLQNGTANNIYALYNYDETSIRMNVPVQYTSTMANTLNSFQFQNVAYGQLTGVQTLRPLELMYYTNTH